MTRSCRLARQAFTEELLQDLSHRDIRANVSIVGFAFEATIGDGIDVNPKALEVLFPNDGWLGDHVPGSLQVHETSGTLEREISLFRIYQMKENDVVPSIAKVSNGVEDGIGIVKKIRDYEKMN